MASAPLPLKFWLIAKAIGIATDFMLKDDGSVNRRIAHFLTSTRPASEKPVDGVLSKDVVLDEATGVWARIFQPSEEALKSSSLESKKIPVLIVFHGGLYVIGSPGNVGHIWLCTEIINRCPCIIVSVDYRLLPDHKYPSQIEDGLNALKWIQSKHQEYLPINADLKNCFLLGDSAGGNLAQQLGVRVAEEDLNPICIKGQILLQPAMAGEERTPSEIRLAYAPFAYVSHSDWRWKFFLPEGSNKDHPACNVSGPNAPDYSAISMPPTFLVIGGFCPYQDWQYRYADALQKAGKTVKVQFYPDAVHGFYVLKGYHLALQVISDVCEFIKENCDSSL